MSSRRSNVRQYSRGKAGYKSSTSEIKKAIRQELAKEIEPKVHYTSGSALSLYDWNGSLIALNDMAQGVTYTTRIGDRVRMKGLAMRFSAVASTADTLCHLRVMLIHWKDNSTPTGADILETTGNGLVVISPKRWHNRKEFNILFDSGALPVYSCTAANGGAPIAISSGLIVKAIPSLICDYDAGATTSNNRLYLAIFEDSNANNIQVSHYVKVTYTDA